MLPPSSGPLSFLASPSLFRDLASHFSLLLPTLRPLWKTPWPRNSQAARLRAQAEAGKLSLSGGQVMTPRTREDVHWRFRKSIRTWERRQLFPSHGLLGKRPPTQHTPASHTSRGGKMTSPRMLPLLMLGGTGNCKFSYFLPSFRLGLAVDPVRILVPRGSLPLANSDIFSVQ